MAEFTIEFDADAILGALDQGAHDGLRSAARFITDEMRRRAPKQTTQLSESIQHGPIDGSFVGGSLSVLFSAGAPYAQYVEEGTRPHIIEPKNRTTPSGRPPALRWGTAGGYIFARKVRHPGTRPQPFFFATVTDNSEIIAEQVADSIELSLLKAGGT